MHILAILNGSVRGFSGGDLHLISVLNEWSREHAVDLYLPVASSPEIGAQLSPRVRVHGQPSGRRPMSRLLYLILVTRRMLVATWYVWTGRGRWDVVIAASHFAFDAIPVLVAGRSTARAVYWWHHATAPRGRPEWVGALVKASEALMVRSFRYHRVKVLTSNSATAKWLTDTGLPSQQVAGTVGGLSIRSSPVSDEEALASQPGLANVVGRKIVLFFARVTKLKGAHELPRIVRAVASASNDAIVVVCGAEGAEAKPIREELRVLEERGVVRFLGFTLDPIKTWLFARAHVFIAPSYEEGWGITIADGLSSGCWVIVYDLPAVREAFPRGPIFVPLGDAESFARATARCLAQERPGQFANAQDYSWQTIAASDLEAILT